MSEQEQSALYHYMRNLHAQGRADEAVRKRGEKFAVAMLYDGLTQRLKEGPITILNTTHESDILLQASAMVLEVCNALGISPAAIKEKIGRTEENEV